VSSHSGAGCGVGTGVGPGVGCGAGATVGSGVGSGVGTGGPVEPPPQMQHAVIALLPSVFPLAMIAASDSSTGTVTSPLAQSSSLL